MKSLVKNTKQFFKELWFFLKSYDIEYIEFFTGLLSFMWGAFLLMPLDTFASTPTFNSLANIAPEWVWGLLAVIFGLMQLRHVVFTNVLWRKYSAFFAILFWWFIAAAFAVANFASTATITYLVVTIAASWSFIRLIQRSHGK